MGKILEGMAQLGKKMGAKKLIETKNNIPKLEKKIAERLKDTDLDYIDKAIDKGKFIISHFEDIHPGRPASYLEAGLAVAKTGYDKLFEIDHRYNRRTKASTGSTANFVFSPDTYRRAYESAKENNEIVLFFSVNSEFSGYGAPPATQESINGLLSSYRGEDHIKISPERYDSKIEMYESTVPGSPARSQVVTYLDDIRFERHDGKVSKEIPHKVEKLKPIKPPKETVAPTAESELFVYFSRDKYKHLLGGYLRMFDNEEFMEKIEFKLNANHLFSFLETFSQTVGVLQQEDEDLCTYNIPTFEADIVMQMAYAKLLGFFNSINNDLSDSNKMVPTDALYFESESKPAKLCGHIQAGSIYSFPEDMIVDQYGKLIDRLTKYQINNKPQKILFQGGPGRGKTVKALYICKTLNIQPIRVSYTTIKGLLQIICMLPRKGRWDNNFDNIESVMTGSAKVEDCEKDYYDSFEEFAIIIDDIDRVIDNPQTIALLLDVLESYSDIWFFFTSNNLAKIPQAIRRPGRLDMIFLEEDITPDYANLVVDRSFDKINMVPSTALRNWAIESFISGGFANLKQVFLRIDIEGEYALPLENEITFTQPASLDKNEIFKEEKNK